QAKSMMVVGNGASLKNLAAGDFIDSHELVFRFNHCFDLPTDQQATGQKLSYWVIAPDCQTPLRLTPEYNCVLSGPEALSWIKNPESLQKLVGHKPLLQIPLQIWRELVLQLGAPPSSGLLILHWLFTLVTNKSVIHRIGFSTPEQFDPAHYHHVLPAHKGSARHHWNMEWTLLEKWFQSQLKSE
ncbi:MAG: glycosyltransferase family 29 protein, partial [Pararheinheimera sp.]|nr:glycosyltransferase family 29 protein [Rheinheimera sp.]